MMTTRLNITGMSCGNCVKHVQKALEQVSAVRTVRVTLENGLAEVLHEGASVSDLLDAVHEEGYEATIVVS